MASWGNQFGQKYGWPNQYVTGPATPAPNYPDLPADQAWIGQLGPHELTQVVNTPSYPDQIRQNAALAMIYIWQNDQAAQAETIQQNEPGTDPLPKYWLTALLETLKQEYPVWFSTFNG